MAIATLLFIGYVIIGLLAVLFFVKPLTYFMSKFRDVIGIVADGSANITRSTAQLLKAGTKVVEKADPIVNGGIQKISNSYIGYIEKTGEIAVDTLTNLDSVATATRYGVHKALVGISSNIDIMGDEFVELVKAYYKGVGATTNVVGVVLTETSKVYFKTIQEIFKTVGLVATEAIQTPFKATSTVVQNLLSVIDKTAPVALEQFADVTNKYFGVLSTGIELGGKLSIGALDVATIAAKEVLGVANTAAGVYGDILPAITPPINTAISSTTNYYKVLLEQIEKGASLGVDVVDTVGKQLPTVISNVGNAVNTVIKLEGEVLKFGAKVTNAVVGSIITFADEFYKAFDSSQEGITQVILATTYGLEMIVKAVSGSVTAIISPVNRIMMLVKTIFDLLNTFMDKVDVLENVVDALT